MHPPLISGPVPPYSNPPITPQYYKPRMYFISAMSLGVTTTITTTVAHDYVIGQLCRLIIPTVNGPYQLNERTGYVLSIPSTTQVLLDINSQNLDAFVSFSQSTQPQIVAIGDISSGNINASGNLITSTVIPGSYQNISPQ